jgi:hypothetical protein
LERDLLGSIVARTVYVAQIVVDGDILAARGVEVEHDVRRIGRAGALERDRGVGDLEFRDAAARQRVGVGLVGDDVDDVAGALQRLGIGAGAARKVVAAIADDALDARPVVILADLARVAPILNEITRRQREILHAHVATPVRAARRRGRRSVVERGTFRQRHS